MTGRGSFRSLTILHYHLLPGGVTDVIVLSVRAILCQMKEVENITIAYGRQDNADRVRKKILAGLDPSAEKKLSFCCLPTLDYGEKQEYLPTPSALLASLEEHFPGKDNLWMVHNYQLGKNPVLTQALLMAAENENRPLLFQIHDFPECSRYANLAALKQGTDKNNYPQRKNLAYCVINDRDRNYLIDAGLNKENIWLLNNPVPLGTTKKADPDTVKAALYKKYASSFPGMKEKGKFVFYPVRSIRRKNLFEAAFLLKMTAQETNFVVSLPGISPTELAYTHLAEQAFKEGIISGLWGIGADEETEQLNYPNFWAASDIIISPSIQEGFGYLYLNALHWRKPLFARSLDIMGGFRSLFDPSSSHFYDQVSLPLTEKEKRTLRTLYKDKLDNLTPFMPAGRKESLSMELEEIFKEDRFCFSYLTPQMQYDYLIKMNRDSIFRNEAASLNQGNLDALEKLFQADVPDKDKAIGETFGEENYIATLRSLMDSLNRGCIEEREDKDIQGRLEERFFSLPYLRLLYGEGK
jgi:hypothetical protein